MGFDINSLFHDELKPNTAPRVLRPTLGNVDKRGRTQFA